jgi:hypothetical protein
VISEKCDRKQKNRDVNFVAADSCFALSVPDTKKIIEYIELRRRLEGAVTVA